MSAFENDNTHVKESQDSHIETRADCCHMPDHDSKTHDVKDDRQRHNDEKPEKNKKILIFLIFAFDI